MARALALVHERSNIAIHINPIDLSALEQFGETELHSLTGGRDVRLIADASLARGGCVVRTPRTEIDASLETQIEEIVSLLLPFSAQTLPETEMGL